MYFPVSETETQSDEVIGQHHVTINGEASTRTSICERQVDSSFHCSKLPTIPDCCQPDLGTAFLGPPCRSGSPPVASLLVSFWLLLCGALWHSVIAGCWSSQGARAARKDTEKRSEGTSPRDAEKDTHLSSFESLSPRPRMLFLPEICVYRGL